MATLNESTSNTPVDLYWRDIKNTSPLSRQEEIDLFKKAHQGDEGARQRLIEANLRFVVSVAREYKDYNLSLAELISEGNMGLLEAVKRFDETRGFKFITYAVWWIRQAILKALAEHGKIARPPMSQLNDLQKLDKLNGRLSQELGRVPTYDELSERVDISAERTRNAFNASQQDLSFDAPAYPDEATPLVAVFDAGDEGADTALERANMHSAVNECMQALNEREYQILNAYFGLGGAEPMTLEQIGDELGVTRERVRQLRNRALDKLRGCGGDVLLDFSSN